MRENLTYGLMRVQGKQAHAWVLRPCPTLQISKAKRFKPGSEYAIRLFLFYNVCSTFTSTPLPEFWGTWGNFWLKLLVIFPEYNYVQDKP